MVDISITADMTKKAIVAAAHKATAVPSMISLYLLFGAILFLAGLGFKDPEASWGRFGIIWVATMLVTGIFLVFFIFSPGAVQWIASKWDILWS